MFSKNHCDDLAQKSRFCYLNRTKMSILDRLSLFFIKVRVSDKADFLGICQKIGGVYDKVYF
jgi:hypothetical protein